MESVVNSVSLIHLTPVCVCVCLTALNSQKLFWCEGCNEKLISSDIHQFVISFLSQREKHMHPCHRHTHTQNIEQHFRLSVKFPWRTGECRQSPVADRGGVMEIKDTKRTQTESRRMRGERKWGERGEKRCRKRGRS